MRFVASDASRLTAGEKSRRCTVNGRYVPVKPTEVADRADGFFGLRDAGSEINGIARASRGCKPSGLLRE